MLRLMSLNTYSHFVSELFVVEFLSFIKVFFSSKYSLIIKNNANNKRKKNIGTKI